MLTPSSGTLADYNAAVLGGNRTHVRLVFPVQNVTLTDDDISADGGLTLTQILNAETDLTFGAAVSNELIVNLLNNGQFTGFDWTEEFRLDFGVEISSVTNWVTVGYFKGKKPERTARVEIIVFTAYDRMQAFDTLADDFVSSLTFPSTLSAIYGDLCTYIGVASVSGDELADAMALTFSANPFNSGITCRQILAWIAEAAGCYARIDAGGHVKLVWFADQTGSYSINGNQYFDISLDEDSAPAIQAIRVGCTYDESVSGFVYPTGTFTTVYQLLDNPFLLNVASGDLITVLTAMMTRFTAFGAYVPMGVNAIGNWMVEPGDIIEVAEGNDTYSMPIFGRALNWNGSCEDGYEATGNSFRAELSESNIESYETGGLIANKYTIKSGVDITDQGVIVSGGKYIKLISGGILDVEATNFTIDSSSGYVGSGDWGFDANGLLLTKDHENTLPQGTTHKIGLALGRNTAPTGVESICYIDFEPLDAYPNLTYPGMQIGVGNNYLSIRKGQRSDSTDPPGTPYSDNIIQPTNGNFCLGTKTKRYYEGFFENLYISSSYYKVLDTSNIANNLTTSAAGSVLDASQGKALKDSVNALSAFANKDIANNLTTSTSGYVLDARQGRTLANRIGTLSNLNTTNKDNIVSAVNEVKLGLDSVSDAYARVSGTSYIDVNTTHITMTDSQIITLHGLCILTVGANVTDSITTSTNLLKVASGYRPSSTIRSIAAVVDRNGNIPARGASFTLDSSGNIKETFTSSWTSGSFCVTFIYSLW